MKRVAGNGSTEGASHRKVDSNVFRKIILSKDHSSETIQ